MWVISLVEKGWASARHVSIELTLQGARVFHLVKGRLPRGLLEVLTPYARMSIYGIPRPWFRVSAWLCLVPAQFMRPFVMVDNQRSVEWIQREFPLLRHRVVLVREGPAGAVQVEAPAEFNALRARS